MTVIVTNCRSGEVVFRAPQGELDKFVAGLQGVEGVAVEKQPDRPKGLPQTVWNWAGQAAFARVVARSSKKDTSQSEKPSGIPQSASRIDFAALSKAQTQSERGLVTN